MYSFYLDLILTKQIGGERRDIMFGNVGSLVLSNKIGAFIMSIRMYSPASVRLVYVEVQLPIGIVCMVTDIE